MDADLAETGKRGAAIEGNYFFAAGWSRLLAVTAGCCRFLKTGPAATGSCGRQERQQPAVEKQTFKVRIGLDWFGLVVIGAGRVFGCS